jgi:hypothetical protein
VLVLTSDLPSAWLAVTPAWKPFQSVSLARVAPAAAQ